MLVSKVTVGFVIQTFDQELGRFTSQEFVAGDDVSYEDGNGDAVDADECKVERGDIMSEPYIGFDMIQPQDNPRVTIDQDLQLNLCTVVDLANENIYKGGDPELDEHVKTQHNAVNSVVKMIEECRRQRDDMPTNEVKPTAYQQVISELANDCDGNVDLLNQALDAMRMEVIQQANA